MEGMRTLYDTNFGQTGLCCLEKLGAFLDGLRRKKMRRSIQKGDAHQQPAGRGMLCTTLYSVTYTVPLQLMSEDCRCDEGKAVLRNEQSNTCFVLLAFRLVDEQSYHTEQVERKDWRTGSQGPHFRSLMNFATAFVTSNDTSPCTSSIKTPPKHLQQASRTSASLWFVPATTVRTRLDLKLKCGWADRRPHMHRIAAEARARAPEAEAPPALGDTAACTAVSRALRYP